MDQVSKPVLIALVAAVALIGVKFTVLRSHNGGGGSTPPSATAPGQAGLQSAIDKAHTAVGVSKQSAKRSEQAAAAASGDSSPSASTPANTPSATKVAKPAAPAKPAAKPAKPLPKLAPGDKSGPMLRDVANGKVVVALFFNPHSADDNAALRAVRAANRHGGRVVVHSIPIADVGNYDAITTGVQVLESPTVIVIGPNDKARTIVGYTDVKEVDQMVGDIGGKRFEATGAKHLTGWAAKASYVCDGDEFHILTSGLPSNPSEVDAFLARGQRIARRSGHRLASIPASGAKQVAAKRAVVAAYGDFDSAFGQMRAAVKSGGGAPAILTIAKRVDGAVKRYQPALHAVGERHCLG